MTEAQNLDRLVRMVMNTNLIALDKAIAAINCKWSSLSFKATRLHGLSWRIVLAAREIGRSLPPDQRA